jgi:hypothetical protein
VARVPQISRQAVYRTPKPRRAPQRRPVTDPVDVAIVETARSYPTDGYRMASGAQIRSLPTWRRILLGACGLRGPDSSCELSSCGRTGFAHAILAIRRSWSRPTSTGGRWERAGRKAQAARLERAVGVRSGAPDAVASRKKR